MNFQIRKISRCTTLRSCRASKDSTWELLDRFPPANKRWLAAEIYSNGSGSFQVRQEGKSPVLFKDTRADSLARERAYRCAKVLAGWSRLV